MVMPFQLRPYQAACVNAVVDDLYGGKKRVAAIMPTGAGKTEVFVSVADQWLKDHPNDSVLVLSHLGLLTEQTLRRFRLRAPHLKVGVLQADRVPEREDRVIISTMQSSRDAKRTDAFRHQAKYKPGLIIVDEAHYLTTESYNAVLTFHMDTKVLGVTATPFRERQVMTNWFDRVSYSISLRELIDQGYLVEPRLLQFTKKTDDVVELMAQVVGLYKTHEQGKKAVVFMSSIEDAKALRNAFVNEGVKARAITSELVGPTRDEILSDFNDSDTMVLTTVNVLSAGFDAPCLEAIFMPYATTSPTLYMQRIGRGLRPAPGKKDCRIYVMGDAPSISKHIYEKLQDEVLNGKKPEWKEHKSYEDDLLFNDPGVKPDLYTWAQKIVEIARKIAKLGHKELATLLVEKKFPPKLLDHIETIEARLIANKSTREQAPATDRQVALLQSWGFENPRDLGKTEASAFITAVLSMHKSDDKFVIQSGKFAGKHVSQLPWSYQSVVLKKFPNSSVGMQIREWNEQKRSRA